MFVERLKFCLVVGDNGVAHGFEALNAVLSPSECRGHHEAY